MNIIEIFRESWEFIIAPGAYGVYRVFRWYLYERHEQNQKGVESQIKSDEAIFEQMEKLSSKLSTLLVDRVEDLQTISRLRSTVNRLKVECPDCVERILKIIDEESS